jgi:hypothetical protein
MNNTYMAVFVKFLFAVKFIFVKRDACTNTNYVTYHKRFFLGGGGGLHGMSHVIRLVTVMI